MNPKRDAHAVPDVVKRRPILLGYIAAIVTVLLLLQIAEIVR